jgi:caffeoyl-CoA O-methyltransferase
MLNNMPSKVRARMRFLERLDGKHRRGDVRHFERLRQIPPATGKLLALLAVGAPEGKILEIGTSGGYSSLWLSLACRELGRKMTTFELSPNKIALARETFSSAGVEDLVELVEGNVLDHLGRYKKVAFCFLDTEKELYLDCYNTVVPNMVRGGVLVADNVASHPDSVGPMVRRVMRDKRVDALIVPMGSGLLVARKA